MNKENENANQTEENISSDKEETIEIKKENVSDDDIGKQNTDDKDFIAEFSPEPIKIPNYNKEKALAKREKKNQRIKKRNTKKAKKVRRVLLKILNIIKATVLFLLLITVVTCALSAILVRTNTSEYSIKSAIRSNSPERFVIGNIKNPSKLNLKKSSSRASVADILRDNSMILVTYDDIEQAVRKSSFSDFVADVSHDVIAYYLYAENYKAPTKNEVAEVLLKNVSYIKLVTGVEIGESACMDYGKYITKSAAFKEISPEALKKQAPAKYTYVTSVMFSVMGLVVMMIALMLLLVLTVIACNGYAHKMIGWAFMISSVTVGILGFLFKPSFSAKSQFVRSVIDAITASFNISALVYGSIAFLVGLLILLIGHAMADEDDYEEEDDYIEEIEQA